MRKVLILAAALVLCAGPAGAQQGDAVAAGYPPAGPAAAPGEARGERAPSLFVSAEVIRARVQQAEAARRTGGSQVENRDALALVAMIALTGLMILVFTG